jgi:hypothetical protein
MHIQWLKRKRAPRYFERGDTVVHLAAQLAKNIRVNGKPVRQHVAYLGGITTLALEIPAQRLYFWEKATSRLNSLEVNGDERQKIERALAKIVPRLTRKEYAEVKRTLKALNIEHDLTPQWRRQILK